MHPITISARELDDVQRVGPFTELDGLLDLGGLRMVTSKQWLMDVFRDATLKGTEVIITNLPGRIAVNGYVTQITPSAGSQIVTFRCTGAPRVLSIKKERVMKIRNRFYVAADSVTTHKEQDQDNVPGQTSLATLCSRTSSGNWTRKNLNDAIAQAEQILDIDPNKEHVAIVRIVRVVRRKKQPIVVEVIK